MEITAVDADTHTGRAVFAGNEIPVNLRLVTAHAGDYVLVHAGCAIETVTKDAAAEMREIFAVLEACASEY
jgi:hydrogenase expression/formation protein HypC